MFGRNDAPSRFTVWKKSSMSFQGTDGFTVFDHRGRLVFRVDNYSRNNQLSDGAGLVLMDGVGNPLLVLRPRGFSIQCRWDAYRGDYGVLFTMRRRMRPLLSRNDKDERVEVFLHGSSRGSDHAATPDFVVEGSFARRNCIVRRNGDGAVVVARIMRKRAKATPTVVLGDDVFSLVVQPGFDPELAMGFVVVLDRICRKPSAPILCS
ncbi:hypothetical protein MLD38_026574 [Melastoma candidum]|uniref:Uncharacterized protein n=1 Tax=Melastoma candidum TaxID=119954 RepID=A0ACB9P2J1_9MYRT|nr:hypothetical protein MLD38_026574 [Melastoma candidum]